MTALCKISSEKMSSKRSSKRYTCLYVSTQIVPFNRISIRQSARIKQEYTYKIYMQTYANRLRITPCRVKNWVYQMQQHFESLQYEVLDTCISQRNTRKEHSAERSSRKAEHNNRLGLYIDRVICCLDWFSIVAYTRISRLILLLPIMLGNIFYNFLWTFLTSQVNISDNALMTSYATFPAYRMKHTNQRSPKDKRISSGGYLESSYHLGKSKCLPSAHQIKHIVQNRPLLVCALCMCTSFSIFCYSEEQLLSNNLTSPV